MQRAYMLVPTYPPLLALAFVLNSFSASSAASSALARPLLVAAVAAVAVQLAASVALRSAHLGALMAGLLLLVLLTPAVGITVGSLAMAVIAHMRRRRRQVSRTAPRGTQFLNLVGAMLMATAVVSSATTGAFYSSAEPNATDPSVPMPDVYVVLLDGYPRSDTLRLEFKLSNMPFIHEMEAKGFSLAGDSRSNYTVTAMTLASMLNYEPVQSLVSVPPPQTSAQYRLLTKLINNSRAVVDLRAHGYEIFSVASPFSNVSLTSADHVFDSGELNEFELSILQTGLLPRLAPQLQRAWIAGDIRNRTIRAIDEIGLIAEAPSDRPRFVFAHLMIPHPPVVFSTSHVQPDAWPCLPVDCTAWDGGQRYGAIALTQIADQVRWVNGAVLALTSRILQASDEPPVIVFFSDHGHRHDPEDRDETLRSIFISSTPGVTDLFPQSITPMSVIPRLLNAYAGASIAYGPEDSYWVNILSTDDEGLFNLEKWSP